MAELSQTDILELEQRLAEMAADSLSDQLSRKSKSDKQFYDGLSATIVADGNNVVGSGLTKYILDKRPYLMDEFLPNIIEKLNKERL